MTKALAWAAFLLGALYFVLPLVGMAEFSLSMRREGYSFDAYASVLGNAEFQRTFAFSALMALVTIVTGVLIVVPTAFWVRRMGGPTSSSLADGDDKHADAFIWWMRKGRYEPATFITF